MRVSSRRNSSACAPRTKVKDMAKTPTLAEAPEPLPTRVVDNRTHLESIPARLGQEPAAGGVDVTEYLTAAHAVGVDRIVQVGCDVESARASLDMPSGPAARLRVGVALHPNEVVAHHRVREESPRAADRRVGQDGRGQRG